MSQSVIKCCKVCENVVKCRKVKMHSMKLHGGHPFSKTKFWHWASFPQPEGAKPGGRHMCYALAAAEEEVLKDGLCELLQVNSVVALWWQSVVLKALRKWGSKLVFKTSQK